MPPRGSKKNLGQGRATSQQAYRMTQQPKQKHFLSNGDIRRLARRGGIKRISSTVYDVARESMYQFLSAIMRDTLIYTQYANRTTVLVNDIVYASRKWGKSVLGFN